MGEYERINKMIARDKKTIDGLREQVENSQDEEEKQLFLEMIYDLEIGVGEMKGALLEMAQVDGLDDPYEAFDF